MELKNLIKEMSRHGKVCYYHREGKGPRTRIHAEFGTDAFLAEYRRIASGTGGPPSPGKPGAPPKGGSLRDLIVTYYRSPEFKRELDPRTQHVRRLILDKLCLAGEEKEKGKPPYGDRPAALMEPRHVRAIRDENADRPCAANGIVKALRRLFAFGIDAEYPGIKTNPARDVKYFRQDGDGHHAWTIDEVRRFEKAHPIGTMPRLALALLLYTGQRRSDVVTFGPGMVRDGWLHFTQFKNRNRKPVTLSLPVIPELQKIIDATPGVGKTWLQTQFRKQFTSNGFGNWFRDHCVAAEVPGRAHGLRKAAASRLAELGCTDREIMAITGHTTTKEIDRYTKAARQKVLAATAMEKYASISPHLSGDVPAPSLMH